MKRVLTASYFLMASVLIAADPTVSQSNERRFSKEIGAIKAAATKGDANSALTGVLTLSEKLKTPGTASLEHVTCAVEGLETVMWSPIDKNDRVREAASSVGLDALAATRGKGLDEPKIMECQLDIALVILPRAAAPPENIARASIQLWVDLLAAIEKYKAYDPYNPKEKNEIPLPPPGYKDAFVFGMDPEGISDPNFRKSYSEYLRRRNEQSILGGKYLRFAGLRDHYLTKLKNMLKTAYSGSPEKEKAGLVALETLVSDPSVRREVLRLMPFAPATQQSTHPASK